MSIQTKQHGDLASPKNKRSMVRRLGAALYNLRTLQVHCAGNGRWVSVRSRPLNDSLKPYLNSYTSTQSISAQVLTVGVSCYLSNIPQLFLFTCLVTQLAPAIATNLHFRPWRIYIHIQEADCLLSTFGRSTGMTTPDRSPGQERQSRGGRVCTPRKLQSHVTTPTPDDKDKRQSTGISMNLGTSTQQVLGWKSVSQSNARDGIRMRSSFGVSRVVKLHQDLISWQWLRACGVSWRKKSHDLARAFEARCTVPESAFNSGLRLQYDTK